MKATNWQYKSGVIVDGISPMFYMSLWSSVGYLISQVAKAPATITAGLDGQHSTNSVHSSGKAVDVRIRDWQCDVDTLAKTIAFYLGNDYVVVQEKDHLHIQVGNRNIVGVIQKIAKGNYIKSSKV